MEKAYCKKLVPYALLPARIVLGITLILAGVGKLQDPMKYVNMVKDLATSKSLLPESLATLYGYALPYAELILGFMLLIGLFTWVSSLLATLMFITFIIATGFMQMGGGIPNKDFAYLALTMALNLGGAGPLSVDSYLKSRKKGRTDTDEMIDHEEE